MLVRTLAAVVISVGLFVAHDFAVAQAPMTNQSIIDLVKAKMSNDIILSAIRGSKPEFDLSANGLIALKDAGVSDAVIQEMLKVNSGGGAPTAVASTGNTNANGINPEEVALIDGSSRQE
jgi:hypothetical protein